MAEDKFTSIDYFIHNSFLGKSAGNRGQKGFLSPDRFKVRFFLPNLFEEYGYIKKNVEEFLSNNVVSIDTPGVTLGEEETPLRHAITRRNSDRFTITFFEDPVISVKNVMWSWIDYIARDRADDDNSLRHYLDEFKSYIHVYPITLDGEQSFRYDVLKDVFPVSIMPVTYDIGQENEIGKISVTMKYRYHLISDDTQQ